MTSYRHYLCSGMERSRVSYIQQEIKADVQSQCHDMNKKLVALLKLTIKIVLVVLLKLTIKISGKG